MCREANDDLNHIWSDVFDKEPEKFWITIGQARRAMALAVNDFLDLACGRDEQFEDTLEQLKEIYKEREDV